ncbi:MAG: hypothetical protein FJ293_11205 [Planctomycetes bacterium]|nr:hypothetical protein [Planctomycetota bacterium]
MRRHETATGLRAAIGATRRGARRVVAAVIATALFATTAVAQEQASAAVPAKAQELSGAGIAFMTLSLLFVWGLALWCFKRVLSTPNVTDPGPAGRP